MLRTHNILFSHKLELNHNFQNSNFAAQKTSNFSSKFQLFFKSCKIFFFQYFWFILVRAIVTLI